MKNKFSIILLVGILSLHCAYTFSAGDESKEIICSDQTREYQYTINTYIIDVPNSEPIYVKLKKGTQLIFASELAKGELSESVIRLSSSHTTFVGTSTGNGSYLGQLTGTNINQIELSCQLLPRLIGAALFN